MGYGRVKCFRGYSRRNGHINYSNWLYAVFVYKGNGAIAPAFFESIYSNWLPNSIYELADRPHFEILGENIKNTVPILSRKYGIQFK